MGNIKEYRGEWFSPKHEHVKLPGILVIDEEQNEIKLVLYSEIDVGGNRIIEQKNRVVFCKIILGTTIDGILITLYDHSSNEGGAPLLEYQINRVLFESVYKPNFAFIGKHFATQESMLFNSYSFRYSYLDSWIDTTRNFFSSTFRL